LTKVLTGKARKGAGLENDGPARRGDIAFGREALFVVVELVGISESHQSQFNVL
jgi:hypothetical protein